MNEDVLSKEMVLGLAKQMYLEVANSTIDAHTISDCISLTASKCREYIDEHVRDLPPVEPAHKAGKWIYVGRPDGMSAVGTNVYRCSECGREIGTKWGWKTVADEFPFCHCGAKMEGTNETN